MRNSNNTSTTTTTDNKHQHNANSNTNTNTNTNTNRTTWRISTAWKASVSVGPSGCWEDGASWLCAVVLMPWVSLCKHLILCKLFHTMVLGSETLKIEIQRTELVRTDHFSTAFRQPLTVAGRRLAG